jgi:hypothetical protein
MCATPTLAKSAVAAAKTAESNAHPIQFISKSYGQIAQRSIAGRAADSPATVGSPSISRAFKARASLKPYAFAVFCSFSSKGRMNSRFHHLADPVWEGFRAGQAPLGL